MPIQIACPECGKKYRFPDERAGNTVDCKDCGAEIEIPGGNRKRSRPRDDDDDMPSPRRRPTKKSGRKGKNSGPNIGLLIGAGVGGLVIVALLAVLLLRRPAANNPQQPMAGNPAVPGGTMPLPGGPSSQPGSQPAGPAVSTKAWKAKVDPPASPVSIDPAASFKIATRAEYGMDARHLQYPAVPSPFVLVGRAGDKKKPLELWNLADGTKVRDVTIAERPSGQIGLSPDGKLLAWYRHGDGGGFDVLDSETGKKVVAIPLPSGQVNISNLVLPSSERLVVTSNVHRKVMSWKLPSGQLEHDITLGEHAQPNEFVSFSPGGRYIAFTGDFLAQTLQIIDLQTGEKAGTIEFADRMLNKGLIGLCFSLDGKELAAAYGQNNGATSDRIVICNMADGKISADFWLPDADQRPLEFGIRQQTLQWFPGGKRLLQNGRHLIDREARKVVFSLPKPSLDFDSDVTRHVLSDSLIASWEGTKESATLAPMSVKESDIARAQEVAASGGLVVDAALPKLTPIDVKRAADKSAMDGAWKAQPDPCPNSAKTVGSISMTGAERPRELKLSRQDSPRAALRLAKDEDDTKAMLAGAHPKLVVVSGPGRNRNRYDIEPVTCRQNWIELFDLADGKSAGRVEIPFPCELVALSPSGGRALVAPMEGQGRLDVFSLPDGAHVAGCRPFGNEEKAEHRDIEAAVFLDENTVAACSRNDRLIVYKLPGCEPVYAVQDAGILALSPGGKLLATCAEGKIEVRDALTGAGLGAVPIIGQAAALSFSAAGDRLAVLTNSGNGSRLNVIELKDGSITGLSITAARGPIIWIGDEQVLVGADRASELIHRTSGPSTIDRYLMLVDLRRQAVLWSYEHGTGDRVTFCNSTFDGRLWVAGVARRAGAKLTAATIPEPAVSSRLQDKALDPLEVIKPGMSVSLQFGVTDPPELAGFAQSVRGIVDAELRNNELNVQDGQPIVLSISATVANGQGNLELQSFGAAGGQSKISIPRRTLTTRVAYESGGKTLWESKADIPNDLFGFIQVNGKTPQQAVDQQMWQRAIEVLRQSQPPSHVYTGATKLGLGRSRLAGDGPGPSDSVK